MQIHWHHMDELPSEAHLEIEERLRQLAAEQRDLIDVRIAGQGTRHHRLGARQARIVCQARGRKIVAVREAASLALAASAVMDAFERELRKRRGRRQSRGARRSALELATWPFTQLSAGPPSA